MICPVLSSYMETHCEIENTMDGLEVENGAIFWIDAEDIANLKEKGAWP